MLNGPAAKSFLSAEPIAALPPAKAPIPVKAVEAAAVLVAIAVALTPTAAILADKAVSPTLSCAIAPLAKPLIAKPSLANTKEPIPPTNIN